MRVASWKDRHTARARRAFEVSRGTMAAVWRAREIAALDSKLWRGQRVYRLTCRAEFGCGPHDQWVPEGLLWTLIDLRMWRCAFHA